MSSDPTRDEFAQRLQTYGAFLGYSFVGMSCIGVFAYKLILSRQQHMRDFNEKGRKPVVHGNLKRYGWIGLVGAVVYSYGFYSIAKTLPETDNDREKADYALLSDRKRFDPDMQQKHIFQALRMFGVSEQLTQKVREEFHQMNPHPAKKEQEIFYWPQWMLDLFGSSKQPQDSPAPKSA